MFSIGMVTGFWLAAAVTKKFGFGDAVLTPQLARAAHLNALFGGLWLIAAAWSFQFLHYGPRGLKRDLFRLTTEPKLVELLAGGAA